MTPLPRFRRQAALALVAILLLGPVPALAERVALVIGNSAYQNVTTLPNPRNDAEAIAAKLASLGFTVVDGYDLGMAEMGMRIRDFARASRGAEMSVVFYAGHGMAVNGENYLVPVDAMMDDETAIDFELVPVSMITNQFDHSDGAHLLFLDACRDNPLAGKLASATGNATRSSASGGLASMEIPNSGTGTGIAFATSPGQVARDGHGSHSPFTEALLANMGAANLAVGSMMNRITSDVLAATENSQRPWFTASFTEDVYFNRVAEPQALAAAPAAGGSGGGSGGGATVPDQTALEDERIVWDYAHDTGEIDAYQLYLDSYPQGRYAPMARLEIERIRRDETARTQTAAAAPAPQATPQAITGYPVQQYASLGNGQQIQQVGDPTRSLMLNGPLLLTPSPYMRAAVANQQTEELLQLGSSNYREGNRVVQARLKAAGYDVGAIDGLIGPGTRKHIGAWQSANGLPPTGYFNALQLQLLYTQSEAGYAEVLNAAPTPPAPQAQSGGNRSSGSGSSRKPSSASNTATNQALQGAVNSFLHGLGTGIGNR